MVEPYAYAKLATRGDVLAPFYITDQHVKAKDASGVPTKIEIVLGRSPPAAVPGQQVQGSYDADYHIGARMKISKKHARIYWSHERQSFCIQSICKNAVKVNQQTFPGSPDGSAGTEAVLDSQACIEIADSPQIFFLLPKQNQPPPKPKHTYEQLVFQVMGPHEKLTFPEIVARIQDAHPFFREGTSQDNWKPSLRSTLLQKTKSFCNFSELDTAGKKVKYFRRNLEEAKPAPAAAGPPAAGAGAAMAPIPAATSEEATPTAGGDDSGNPVSQAPVIDVG